MTECKKSKFNSEDSALHYIKTVLGSTKGKSYFCNTCIAWHITKKGNRKRIQIVEEKVINENLVSRRVAAQKKIIAVYCITIENQRKIIVSLEKKVAQLKIEITQVRYGFNSKQRI